MVRVIRAVTATEIVLTSTRQTTRVGPSRSLRKARDALPRRIRQSGIRIQRRNGVAFPPPAPRPQIKRPAPSENATLAWPAERVPRYTARRHNNFLTLIKSRQWRRCGLHCYDANSPSSPRQGRR